MISAAIAHRQCDARRVLTLAEGVASLPFRLRGASLNSTSLGITTVD
jgi:hypothetical protein